jgi:4-hydroxy-tetrahydrodipicolinate reductase
MGAAVCGAVLGDPELELVAAVDPAFAGEGIPGTGLVAAASIEVLAEARAEVAVDFSVAAAALQNAAWCAAHGVHAVIGTTGFGDVGLLELEATFAERGTTGSSAPGKEANCVVAPNFAIGAVLMMRFAELAAPWFETVEVIEMHHDRKVDAPSGTALLTAQRISAARRNPGAADDQRCARGDESAPGVRVHSVRLRGLVAHQEVLLGTTGQVLTLRHDSLDRNSFMPGVLLAVKAVADRPGFTLGLEPILGL